MEMKPPFEILINDSLLHLVSSFKEKPATNKYIQSLINDFEDGKWRTEKFMCFIFDNMAETALSAEEREKLYGNSFTLLSRAATKVRMAKNDKGEGSEIAEIMLYGIMKHYYGALPVVPKIFYKQNTMDNAKGADSVHIVIEQDKFSLWYGEAKFYKSIENARLDTIVCSVHDTISLDKLKKENSIVTDTKDLDALIKDTTMCQKIKSLLAPETSLDKIKPILHIPILLLYECDLTSKETSLTDQYRQNLITYHKERAKTYFAKQIEQCKDIYLYDKITFHLILFPIPKKDEIVEKYKNTINTLK